MAQARLSIVATGAAEWIDLSKKLRRAPAEFRTGLRKTIQQAGQPVLDEVKAAARSVPVTSSRGGGGLRRAQYHAFRAEEAARRAGRDTEAAIARGLKKPRGLRRNVANAAKLQVRSRGIRFVVDSSSMPESQRNLPRHLDSPKGWRHPVFGDRNNWVHQQGKPYFGVTIKKRSNDFRKAILAAMEETANKIQN